MQYIINFFTSAWNWVMKHSVGFICGGLVLIYMLANSASIEAKSRIEQENLECKAACFPSQYEFIQSPIDNTCWCYTDQNTLKRIEQ
tara:strand:+ start:266 stop:526 length:261 start_codon:yes stop_codon:yes gene_type:complete